MIDGDKNDGIVSIIKELQKQISFDVNLSKAHGKIAVYKTASGNYLQLGTPINLIKLTMSL